MARSKKRGMKGDQEGADAQIEFPMEVSVCAWCHPGSGGSDVKIRSHGICLRHLRVMKLGLLKLTARAA